jgi:hypothetical protein
MRSEECNISTRKSFPRVDNATKAIDKDVNCLDDVAEGLSVCSLFVIFENDSYVCGLDGVFFND